MDQPTKRLTDGRLLYFVENPAGELAFMATCVDEYLSLQQRLKIEQHRCNNIHCCLRPSQRALRGEPAEEITEYTLATTHGHTTRTVDGPVGKNLQVIYYSRLEPGFTTDPCYHASPCTTHELLTEYRAYKEGRGEPVKEAPSEMPTSIGGLPPGLLEALFGNWGPFSGQRGATVIRFGYGTENPHR